MAALEELTRIRHRHRGYSGTIGAGRGLFLDPVQEIFWSRPSLTIRHTDASEPELAVVKTARGHGQLSADLNAENLVYNWEIRDSVLVVGNFFTTGEDMSWNFGGVTLRLNLPEGYSVHLGERTDRIITSARNAERVSVQSMTGKKWIMTKEGLSPR